MLRGVSQKTKRNLSFLVVIIAIVSLVTLNIFVPINKSETSAALPSSISKTSSDDWNAGTLSGVQTSNDEVKISSTEGWVDQNYGFRKSVSVTAKEDNAIAKGHTLNLAGVGSASFEPSDTGGFFDLGNSFNNIALPITIEAWINPLAAETAIFGSDMLNGGSYYGFWFWIDGNRKVTINYGDGGGGTVNDRRTKVSETAVSLNTWSHVSAVIRGETDMSLYINGVDAGGSYSGAGSSIVYSGSADYHTRIGAWNVGSPHTKGNIDELRIWSKAKTQSEIVAEMSKEIPAQTNLEGYYNFNQTAGNLIDNSGHNITGTLGGNVAYSPYSNVWGGLNTKELIDAGKMRSDGNDLRMFYGSTEIERELIPMTGKTLATSESTQVLYKAQAAVLAGATDNYYLYYGDSDAADPITTVYNKKFRTKNAYVTPYNGNGSNYLQYSGDNFPTNGDGTIEFWYKTSNAGSRHADSGPIFSGDDANANWYLWNDRWGYRMAASIGGNLLLPTDPGNIKDARGWNHTVITWHNNQSTADVKIYENGTLTGSLDGGTKITSFPSYVKFSDGYSSYDGVEIGLVAAFNTVKDSNWISAEYARSSTVPVADGLRDASATFIHNFDGSGLDATADNGAYASGTATATNSGAIIAGDYRQGDTNDERAGNTWVSGIYNWFDNFDTGNAKSQGINEFGNLANVANEMVLKNGQQAIINQGSANMPTNYRLDISAKGVQPEILFNHQDKTGWWGNGMCMVDIAGVNNNSTDLLFPRDDATGFLSSATSKYYLNIYNGFAPKYIQFDLATGGNYTGIVFEYWNGTAWTAFTPVSDGTSNFSQSGIIDISNIIASFGANPASDGACSFPSNHSVLRFSASAVTTEATINQITRVNDYAKIAYSATANTISGDAHNTAGTFAAARATDAYKQLSVRRVGAGMQTYLEGWRTLNTTSNAVFDSNLLGLSATTNATFDNLKIYKALANEPTTAALAETAKYLTGSSYLSPTSTGTGSGVIDLGWIGSWGNPNGFSANVVIPTNTSIAFSVRSSAVAGSNDADWTDWGTIGTATTTGNFTVNTASMPNITLGTNRYLQLKAIFNTSDGLNSPVLSDYTIHYVGDADAPSNPTVSSLTVNGNAITDGSWTNASGNIVATFSGATDPGTESGVGGYYVYFGTSDSVDPVTVGTYQAHQGALDDPQVYNSSISTSDDGKYYYLIIRTSDVARNISSSSIMFDFGYDVSAPVRPSFIGATPAGYTTNNSFSFSWPAGSDPVGIGGSAAEIRWYEFKRATDAEWSHTADANTLLASGILAYQEGVNAFYVRSVDNAGNTSDHQQVTYYWSGTAPSKPTNLNVSPNTSDSNDFTVTWNKSVTGLGQPGVVGYYYSVNAQPTIQNVTYVPSTADQISIGPSPFATLQGTNTIYIVGVNSAGNLSFEPDYVASATFSCQTPAPPTPTSVALYDSSDRVLDRWMLTLQWAAGSNQNAETFDHYSIERSTNGTDFSMLATTISTAYIDSLDLNNATTYSYRIKAVDNAGKESAVSSTVQRKPAGKYLTPPAFLSQPEVTQIKSNGAQISWITDRASTSVVRYGTDADNLAFSTGNFDNITNHRITLLGIKPSSTYYFQVQSMDEDRDYEPADAYSQTFSFITLPAPAISNVNVENITLTSADISFETTTVSNSLINYGISTNYNLTVEDKSGAGTISHKVKIANLASGTNYHFKIRGTDIDGNNLISDDYSFETMSPPKVTDLKITPIDGEASFTAKVTWNTNVDATTILRYAANGQGDEVVSAKPTRNHEVLISNLLDNASYVVEATGRDQFGNLADTVSQQLKTPEDSRPPKISNFNVETNISGNASDAKSQIIVSWQTDELSRSMVEFGEGTDSDGYTNSTRENESLTKEHLVIISDLRNQKPYHLRAVSHDGAGNVVRSENTVIVTKKPKTAALNVVIDALTKTLGFLGKAFR